jgi:hypothetical protein
MQSLKSYTQAWHEFKSFFAMDGIDDIYTRQVSLAGLSGFEPRPTKGPYRGFRVRCVLPGDVH